MSLHSDIPYKWVFSLVPNFRFIRGSHRSAKIRIRVVASIELSSTHFHNYLFIFVLKCVIEMALFKYLTKEKDKLVEGEEFVKANELVEEMYFSDSEPTGLPLMLRA